MATVRYNSEVGKYFLDWYEDGRRHRLCVGSDEKHAERELEKLKAKLLMKRMGLVSFAETQGGLGKKRKIPALSIEDAIQKYLNYSKTNHSPMNYQCSAYVLNGPFLSFIRRKRVRYVTQVTPEIIEDYKASRLKGESKSRKIKPTSINRQITTLKAMFKRLTEWGYLESNPTEKTGKIKFVEEDIGRCLSQAECRQLLEASRKCNSGNFYYAVATALGTGLRKSELKNLRVEDVDLKKREIKVVNRGAEARTKTGKNRIVDLSVNLVEILSKHTPKSECMFDFTNFRRNWEKTKKLSGVACRFHDLRHTFITICLQNGIQPASVADWVGHADLRMIMKIYKHLQRDHLKQEINKLNSLYNGYAA